MSSPNPPEFQVLPITPADLPSMIDVYIPAFGREFINSYALPAATCTRENKIRWLTKRFGGFFSQPELRMDKVVETATGKTVAWSRWAIPYTLTPEEQEQRQKQKEVEQREIQEGTRTEWPEGANIDVCKQLFESLDAMREKYVDPSQMYLVHMIATHPDYQRRGLATLLLRHGLAIADAENKKTYIEATGQGHPVYLRLGWKDVDRVVFDLKKYGVDEPTYHWVLIREPGAKAE